jgi:histone acetyltransferase (RNA polymerase elongator complex component)
MSNIRTIDIEELNGKLDIVLAKTFDAPTSDCVEKFKYIIHAILDNPDITLDGLKMVKNKFKFSGKNSFLLAIFEIMKNTNMIDTNADVSTVRQLLRIKKGKSHSGVLVITVFTSPYPEYIDDNGETQIQAFSCKWNCNFCPNEPGQPRSYLKGEPGVLRANKNEFDACRQMWDRMNALYRIGHPVDKLEILVLGGTWASYPESYREQFCRDLYYAANLWVPPHMTARGSHGFGFNGVPRRDIEEEKRINRTANAKIIGLTLETRPDTINDSELILLRKYGCTRVQLGIQHTHNDVLNRINRKCSIETAAGAIKSLKNAGMKIDAHWMPNLPGSSVEKDRHMFMDMLLGTNSPVPKRNWCFNEKLGIKELYEVWDLKCPELQVDQWKIYPTAIVPWTEIEKEFNSGKYVPYSEQELLDLLLQIKPLIFKKLRVNRLIRDIPTTYIINCPDSPNMRQELGVILDKDGTYCQCIRCREIKGKVSDVEKVLVVAKYNESGGDEYFISVESTDFKTLFGFLRLRITREISNAFPELNGCAMIRELHVYGQLIETSDKCVNASRVQHKGLGKMLIIKAKEIAKECGLTKISVIAGEGTRGYYEKSGFMDDDGKGRFMISRVCT